MTMPPTYPELMPDDPLHVYDPQAHVPDMTDPVIGAMQATMAMYQGEVHEDAAPSQANETIAPNVPDQLESIPGNEQKIMLALALYGSDFPAVNPGHVPSDWASWVKGRWNAHRAAVTKHLHLVERNRLFRAGQQWVSSSKGNGPWREPMKPSDSSRSVMNLIDKALDQRLQIMNDQRPGFAVEPTTYDPDDKKKAEARQVALEYQYDQQGMEDHRQVAGYWAQTDGCSFWQTYWDADAGPWDERMGEHPDETKPLGDLRTRTLRCEQVRVSANATRTEPPYYVIIREVIPATEAAYRYGIAGVNPNAPTDVGSGNADSTDSGMNRWVLDQTTVGEGDRLRDQESVERFTMYVDRQPDVLPHGLELVIIGDEVVVGPLPLLFKCIPVVPVRDGSSDPSYYNRPVMEQWIDPQMRINALVSAIVDSIRANKGGRFLARPGAVVQETFVGGGTSIIEVNGAIGNLDDVIKPVNSFSIGEDVKDQLEREIKAFENASGYNDQSRGQISGDASGRAILAAREQLERVFAPGVQAMARSFTEWAKIQIAGMAFGYDVPRDLGTVGNGRPDLAHQLTRDSFDGLCDVKVEADTLMPVPRAYRDFELDNLLDRGLITGQQYLRRRAGGSFLRDLTTPDEDQDARAQRIVEAILRRQPVPEMRWQDNEAIHQDVLERECILRDDLQPDLIAAAQQRWADLASQAQMKSGGMMPPPSPAPGGAPGPAPTPPAGPSTAPLMSSNPSLGGQMDPTVEGQATQQFEQTATQ